LGGVGGLPVEGVKGALIVEEAFSRGFLNIAGCYNMRSKFDVGLDIRHSLFAIRSGIYHTTQGAIAMGVVHYVKESISKSSSCSSTEVLSVSSGEGSDAKIEAESLNASPRDIKFILKRGSSQESTMPIPGISPGDFSLPDGFHTECGLLVWKNWVLLF
jgi:hypothetical protein